MIFFNLLALMDDDDNEGRGGILWILFVMVCYRLKTCMRRSYNATVPPSGRPVLQLVGVVLW